MKSYFEKLVEEKGIEFAHSYMKDLRAKVKKPGLANASKETKMRVSKMGLESRADKKATQEKTE
jgi:hypothetical protein